MNATHEINLTALDDMAYTITERHGQILGNQEGAKTRETFVYINDGEEGQLLFLLHSSLRRWYLYSEGDRRTRSGQEAVALNFVRSESGMFVVSGYKTDHLDRPQVPADMQRFAPVPGERPAKYDTSYNAGPRSLKRAYFLLNAIAVELGD